MKSAFKVGEWVEVRSKNEILATLDSKGCLDGMPFMPEMLMFCGQKFQVEKSAHKTCDYSSPTIRSRWVENTIHLKTRCDGSAHDGCQAGCLLYWKDAWLKPATESGTPNRMNQLRECEWLYRGRPAGEYKDRRPERRTTHLHLPDNTDPVCDERSRVVGSSASTFKIIGLAM